MAPPVTTSGDVKALLDEVNAAGGALLGGHTGADQLPDGPARHRLIAAAQDLIAKLQNPGEAIMELGFQVRRRLLDIDKGFLAF